MRHILTIFCVHFVFSVFGQVSFEKYPIIKEDGHFGIDKQNHMDDIDGDGDLDLFISTSGKVAWLENLNGLGSFSEAHYFNLDGRTAGGGITTWDWDQDGDKDVIFASTYGSYMYWIENLDSSKEYDIPKRINGNFRDSETIYFYNIDDDPLPEIIAQYSNGITIYDYNLIEQKYLASSSYLHSYYSNNIPWKLLDIDISDIDADNNLDFILAFEEYGSLINLKTENGVISDTVNMPVEFSVFQVETGDLDGDGHLDIFCSDTDVGDIKCFLGNGNYEFGPPQVLANIGSDCKRFRLFDLEQDSDSDIMCIGYGRRAPLFENKNQEFIPIDTVWTSLFETNTFFEDINADGVSDIYNGMGWFKSISGNMKYTPHQGIDSPQYFEGAKAIDIDKDGDLDIMGFNRNEIVWFENINFTFASHGIRKLPFRIRSIDFEDINKDGSYDVAVLGDPGIVGYLLNSNNIDNVLFGELKILESGAAKELFQVQIVDINADGFQDIFYILDNGSTEVSRCFYNIDGQANFSDGVTIGHDSPDHLWAVDLDGDDDLDFVGIDRSRVEILINSDEDRPFKLAPSNLNRLVGEFAFPADFDGDGDIDLLRQYGWQENTGERKRFSEDQNKVENLSNYKGGIAADVDQDGDYDIISRTLDGGSFSWFENTNGLGDFSRVHDLDSLRSNLADMRPFSKPVIISTDFDLDSDMDILVINTDYYGYQLCWYQNQRNDLNVDEDSDGFLAAVDCDDTNPNINADQVEVPYNGLDDDCDPATLDDDLDRDGIPHEMDCDDTNPNIHSGHDEVPYNGVDDDCDAATLDDDLDQDGYPLAMDCDDNNPDINKDQVEIPYNGLDDDCDVSTLDDDLDQDGFVLADDCDDSDPDITDGQTEIPYNGLDDDCDAATLDDDLDQDGYPLIMDCDDNNPDINRDQVEIPYNGLDDDCDAATLDDDLDQDGFVLADDCDDSDPDITDGQTEIPYNGLDDDCDAATLDDDLDQDGYPLIMDCDDNNPDINKDQVEIPYNGIDDDCDATTLDDDLDQDGYVLAIDCDDTNPEVHEGQDEVPYNGLDDDCDAATLDDDLDQDGYVLAIDCDDTNPDIHSGQEEIPYNGVDDDCDATTLDDDLDQDGYVLAIDCDDTNPDIQGGQEEIPYNGLDDDCDVTTLDDDLDKDGYVLALDCDDTNAEVHSGQEEIPYNGLDDDCDITTLDDDLDQDGYVLAMDCDDTDPNIKPNAEEIVGNQIDEDCDGFDLGSNEITESNVGVFPNPSQDFINLEFEYPITFSASIYNLEGDLINQYNNQVSISIQSLPPGNYLIIIENLVSGIKITKRIVKGN